MRERHPVDCLCGARFRAPFADVTLRDVMLAKRGDWKEELERRATGGEYTCPECGRTGRAPLSPAFGLSPRPERVGYCPFCGAKLRTHRAKLCVTCGRSWHGSE